MCPQGLSTGGCSGQCQRQVTKTRRINQGWGVTRGRRARRRHQSEKAPYGECPKMCQSEAHCRHGRDSLQRSKWSLHFECWHLSQRQQFWETSRQTVKLLRVCFSLFMLNWFNECLGFYFIDWLNFLSPSQIWWWAKLNTWFGWRDI